MRDGRFLLIHLIQTPDDTERANTNFLADGVTEANPLKNFFSLNFSIFPALLQLDENEIYLLCQHKKSFMHLFVYANHQPIFWHRHPDVLA